jgi:hypothetical protein
MPIGGPNPNAWRNWYHGVGCTYGTWLRGDPRGFRTHKHRMHVQGDYRNPPPPGVWAPMLERSKRAMKWPPVVLALDAREVLCRVLVQWLQKLEVKVATLAVASNHFHLLARFPPLDAEIIATFGNSILRDGRDPAPRHLLGMARREASWQLKDVGLKPASPVWGRRPKFDPIRDHEHQVNVANYIHRRRLTGAAVWAAWE